MPIPRTLILDDDQNRHCAFDRYLAKTLRTHVYTAPQAIDALKKSPPFDIVFLDYDLPRSDNIISSRSPGTGLDVATHIANFLPANQKPGRVWIHTWNPTGQRAMARVLTNAGIPVTIQRFRAI